MSIIVNRDAIRRAAALRKSKPREPGQPYKTPTVYSKRLIRELLTSGHSIASVASIVGCSTWPVQQVRKEMKQFGFEFNDKKGESNGAHTKIKTAQQAFWSRVTSREDNRSPWNGNYKQELVRGASGQIHTQAVEAEKEKEIYQIGE